MKTIEMVNELNEASEILAVVCAGNKKLPSDVLKSLSDAKQKIKDVSNTLVNNGGEMVERSC